MSILSNAYEECARSEPEEGPPAPPGRGGPHACSGASCMLRRRAVLGTPKCEKSVGRRGSAPDLAGGAYCPLPKNPSYNIVIVLVLCVSTHVYENALLFSLEC